MASASLGFELPATSLIAPFLAAINPLPQSAQVRGPGGDNKAPPGHQYTGFCCPSAFSCRSGGERNRVDMPAIIGLGVMGRAAIGIELRGVAIGADGKILDVPD